jgi:hypothetical protein
VHSKHQAGKPHFGYRLIVYDIGRPILFAPSSFPHPFSLLYPLHFGFGSPGCFPVSFFCVVLALNSNLDHTHVLIVACFVLFSSSPRRACV